MTPDEVAAFADSVAAGYPWTPERRARVAHLLRMFRSSDAPTPHSREGDLAPRKAS